MSCTAMSSCLLLPLLLVAGLAACGREAPVAPAARVEGLQTFQVPAAEAAGGRAWEGVVEAVQQATLSTQTNGRVAAVERDVNDRVAAGDVLVRLSAVEQQAGVDAARAQLRAAEASATEADANRREVERTIYDVATDAEVEEAKAAKKLPFGGRVDPMKRVADADLLTILPRRGTALDVATRTAAAPERALTLFEAAAELARRGVAMDADKNRLVREWLPDGVPESALDDLQARLTVRAGLRVVGGAS